MADPIILLATDFSEEAERAYAPTIELARQLGTRVELIHVVPDLLAIPYGAAMAPMQHEPDLDDRMAHARKMLDEEVKKLTGDVEVTGEVLSGSLPEKTLTDYARDQGARFIAMASHGYSGLRRLVMGSFAESVLHRSATPVIVFPRLK